MPPKRKTTRGGGRPKRPRESSPGAKGSEEQVGKRQRIDSNSVTDAPGGTEGASLKALDKTLLGEGDEDADGEDDKAGATRDENVGETSVPAHPDAEHEHEEQDMEHEAEKQGGEDNHNDDGDNAELQPSTSTRGRGRGRGRRSRGAGAGRTRSSSRKLIQETQAQSTSNPPNVHGRRGTRGRGRGKGRGAVVSNPPPTEAPAAKEVSSDSGGKGEVETKEKEDEEETDVLQHQPLSQPPSSQHQFQDDHAEQQPSNQIPVIDHALPPPVTFAPHAHPYYPSYPSHPSPFQYTYVVPTLPPGTAAPDGRPYLALRPDGTQPIYGTSFATTTGTANGTGSASSSFAAPYPASGAAANSLDTNAPQGNPFPPSGHVPIPAYGTAVYSVGVSDDDDDDQEQEQTQTSGIGGNIDPGKKKGQPAVKAGGRAGRGDHVACHFCRGMCLVVVSSSYRNCTF